MNRRHVSFWNVAVGLILLMGIVGCGGKEAARWDGRQMVATPLQSLTATEGCDKCRDWLLPGRTIPHPEAKYTLWSDLPEIFCSPGVLYTTVSPLPPDPNGSPSFEMRTQVGFDTFQFVDNSFDVFMFHTVYHCDTKEPRRVVVYVQNVGKGEVSLYPKQVISTDGEIGRVHQMEGNLAKRVLGEEWDIPIESITIPAGEGRVAAFSKQFAMKSNGPDSSTNTNCFGYARVSVDNAFASQNPTQLNVYVVGIDAGPMEENDARATRVLDVAALSRESHIDFSTRPSGCEVRRATGVFRSFFWQSDPVALDIASLNPEGVSFPMALWNRVTEGCPSASQTVDFLLHPPYNRDDTIGNYMTEYRVTFEMFNSDPTDRRTVDVRFGKDDADIGLVWRTQLVNPLQPTDVPLSSHPIRMGWAGPKQSGMTRSFLEFDGGPITLGPGESRVINLQFMVQGNSSLPFDIEVVATEPGTESTSE